MKHPKVTRGVPLPDLVEALKQRGNKFNARRTYSELCGRTFASKAEAVRGEELTLLEKVGQIEDLRYQVRFKLCDVPKIAVTLDFTYLAEGKRIYEDTKGVLTRDSRTKFAWLKEKFGVEVLITQ